MWNWYLEWGEMARIAISDRRLLRQLGFLGPKRGARNVEAGEDEEGVAESEEIEEDAELGAV